MSIIKPTMIKKSMALCMQHASRSFALQAEGSSLPYFKIKTFNAISKEGLMKGFDYTRFEVSADSTSPHAILLRSHNLQLSEVDASVCAIARCGAGVNNVPVDELTKRAVPVFNTPGSNANAVKELVLCGLFLASRKIVPGINHVKTIVAEENDDPAKVKKRVESDKKMFGGQEVMGKTLAVAGLGNIGAKVAKAGLDLGMKVIGFDPGMSLEYAWSLPGDRMELAESLEDMCKKADYISLHMPYMKETHHILGKSLIGKLKKGAHLLNFSRAELVDGEALATAINEGSFKGQYVTDFPDKAVHGLEQCTCIPHLGASTGEAEVMSAQMAAQQISSFLSNGDIRHSVNFPSVSLPAREATQTRLCIVNENSSGSLGNIFTHLGSLDLNITQHVNSSRGEIAYNVLDIDSIVPDYQHLLSSLDQVPGVLTGRLITNLPERFYHKCMHGSSVSGS